MNDEKRKALEAAGWKFGDAEDFLNEGGMMDADKMRAEFEAWAWAKASNYCLTTWQVWQAAYAAGRKAEREAMQLKNWDGVRLGTTGKPEGER